MQETTTTTEEQGDTKLYGVLHFLDRNPKYDSEKPYTVRYDTEGKFPYTNIENVRERIQIHDLRDGGTDLPERFSLDKNGFTIITIPDEMSYDEFNDDEVMRAKHLPKVLTTVQRNLKAGKIHVLDYRVCPLVQRTRLSH